MRKIIEDAYENTRYVYCESISYRCRIKQIFLVKFNELGLECIKIKLFFVALQYQLFDNQYLIKSRSPYIQKKKMSGFPYKDLPRIWR